MKLAEALQERADLNTRIAQLESRIYNNTYVQEGEEPAEDPAPILDELNDCMSRLETLIRQINLSNCTHTIDGKTLTAWIARKDVLRLQCNSLRDIISHASQAASRARNTEIKILTVIDVKKLRAREDAAAKELRLIDNKLQQANWTYDLIED